MPEYPQFQYGIKDVKRAGDALRGKLIWTEDSADGIREVFKIASSWRDSHVLPMRKLRAELIGQIRRTGTKGQTAARLKRMPSIRRKLRNIPVPLSSIQDLAGCRAILPSIFEVNTVIEGLRSGSVHELIKEDPYIIEPKSDGYRSHHMIFKFKADDETAAFDGRKVEVQIRSHLQHSWATAVEAIGMYRQEDLKAGQGDADWLRLFKLMSSEIALAEECLEAAGAGPRKHRINEITALEEKLRAVAALEDMRQAVRYVEEYVQKATDTPEYYLIKYNRAAGSVSVQPYSEPYGGVRSLDAVEVNSSEKGDHINAVLVEVDSIENLMAAYPNYFGDVQRFKGILEKITQGAEPREYVMPPQALAPKKPYETPDLTWFTRRRFPPPKGG